MTKRKRPAALPALSRRAAMAALAATAILGTLLGTTPTALAQAKLPSTIRLMLPFGAGSVSDVTMRLVGEGLSKRIGIPVVIENQPRAGGVTAATTTRSAPADGSTLVIFSGSTAISVSLLRNIPYDPVKEFTPVAGVSTFANILATGGSAPYKTFEDFAKAARAKPGTLNVGTTTVGSTNHLAATLLRSMTRLDFVIVPFRTPADLTAAAMRGEVDMIVQSYGALKGLLADKKLVALASTPLKRPAYAPDIPTLDEAGVKGFDVNSWNGLFAPAKTPDDVVQHLNREINAVLDDPAIRKRLLDLGLETLPTTPAEIGERLAKEIPLWASVIEEAKIEKQ